MRSRPWRELADPIMAESTLPVGLPPMANRDDRDQLGRIVHRVDDPVIADAETEVRRPLQAKRLSWVGIVSKRLHSRVDPPGHLGGDRLQLALGCSKDPERIGQRLSPDDLVHHLIPRSARLIGPLCDDGEVDGILQLRS